MNHDNTNETLCAKPSTHLAPTTLAQQYDNKPQLLTEPRRVAAGMGIRWISHAWIIFKTRWEVWFSMGLMMGLATAAAVSLSDQMIGILLVSFVVPFLWGGVILSCDALVENDKLKLRYLFLGFKVKFLALFQLALLHSALVMAVAWIVMNREIPASGSSIPLDLLNIDIKMIDDVLEALREENEKKLIATAVWVSPVLALTWFVPAMICLHDVSVWRAIKMSVRACIKNVKPFIVYILAIELLLALMITLIIVVFIVSLVFLMSLLLLGALIAVANAALLLAVLYTIATMLIMIASYTSYRSIWTTPTLED